MRRGRTLADPKPVLSRNPDPAAAFPFVLTAALPTNTPRRPSGQPGSFGRRIDTGLAGDIDCGWPVYLESVAMIFANFAVAGALLPVKSIGG